MTLQDVSRNTSFAIAAPTRHATENKDAQNAPGNETEHMRTDPPPTFARHPWHRRYRRAVFAVDAGVLIVAVLLAEFLRFDLDTVLTTGTQITYTVLGVGIAAVWWIALQVDGATDVRVLGNGSLEYRRVVHASVMAFGIVAIISLLIGQDLSRGYLAIAFPTGLLGLIAGRKLLRNWLIRARRTGAMTTNVLVVGGPRSAKSIDGYLQRHPEAGFRVTGVWVPDEAEMGQRWLESPNRSLPILGSERSLHDAASITKAGAVIVTDTEHLGHAGLKELIWELQAFDIDLLVAPNVVDVSGARIQLSTVAQMPFLHVRKPSYEAAAAWPKTLFDKVGATLVLLAASPVMLLAALAIKMTSPGPVFFRQERIGMDGQPFSMLKFRSMRLGADAQLASLLAESGQVAGPLAKVSQDPRITPVGGLLRRLSIDELPQLINVLLGSMSLVGPRPQRQFEVDMYDEAAHRRLRVRPGMTGLWQVSGRSDLTWEDAIRLDTYYVENWSMTGDVTILWKTVRAVLGSDGAY